MDRFDPFVKYADVYGDIINWEKDPMNRPQNQNKYFFSDGKTYYEQLLRIMRLVSVFKDAFNQIYNNEDEISTAWENFVNNLSATAVPGEDPSVELVWTDDSVQFNFTMPQGLPGPQGVSISSITFNQDYSMTITLSNGQTYTSSSLRGPEGPEGSGLEILDVYPTLADLQTAHPTGSPGDAYQVGSGSSFTLYIWSASQNAWVNAGTLSSPSPSSASPSMNGTASAGSSMLYSRGDHVHPSDTGKLDKSSTNGVYAVENGSQTMLNATVNPQQGALVKWDTNGTLNANAVDTDTARIQGNISADTGTFQTSITTGNITASGDISADTIEVADNLILNSTKLEGVAGSTNAYQILTTLGADRDVLGMGADATDNTPSVKFMAGKWANNGTMGDATSEVKFNNSFAPDYNYDPSGGRIGLVPASANVLGGVKVGSRLSVTSDGTINVHEILEQGRLTLNSSTQSSAGNWWGLDGDMLTVGFKIQAPGGGFSNGTVLFEFPYRTYSGNSFVPVYVSSDQWYSSNTSIKYAFLTVESTQFKVSTIPGNYWVMGWFSVLIDR